MAGSMDPGPHCILDPRKMIMAINKNVFVHLDDCIHLLLFLSSVVLAMSV